MGNKGSTHLNLRRIYEKRSGHRGVGPQIICGWMEIRDIGQKSRATGVAYKGKTEVGKVKYERRTRRSLELTKKRRLFRRSNVVLRQRPRS